MQKLFFKILIILLTVSFFKSVDAATFQVTTTADRNNGSCNPGDCSLREAVRSANANPNEAHTILLKSGNTYSLTISGEDDTAEKGDLDLKGNITIQSDGDAAVILDAGGKAGLKDRIFEVLKNSNVTLSNLIIQNGFLLKFPIPDIDPNKIDPNQILTSLPDSLPWGAGVHNSGSLTLNKVVVQKNSGSPINEKTGQPEPGIGVGISNDVSGKLILNNSTVTEQTGEMGTIGISNVKGEVILNNSRIFKNSAVGFNNNGKIEMGISLGVGGLFGKVTLNNSEISQNSGNIVASGIASIGTDLTLQGSLISGNNAEDKNANKTTTYSIGIGVIEGNILIQNSKIVDHQGSLTDPSETYGLSYLNFSPNGQVLKGNVTIQKSEISRNKSRSGTYLIYESFFTAADRDKTDWLIEDSSVNENESSQEELRAILSLRPDQAEMSYWNIRRTSISKNNSSWFLSGIENQSLHNQWIIEGVTISENIAPAFIGVDNFGGSFIIKNSTISDNLFNENPRIISNSTGISMSLGTVDLLYSTITSNFSAKDKKNGIGIQIHARGGKLRLKGNILSQQEVNCLIIGGTVQSEGFNLSSDNKCTFFDPAKMDISNTDPILAPLADNGGFTLSHALTDTSPALNQIPENNCNDFDGNPILIDQRGVIRPAGGACDIGAFEKATIAISLNNQSFRFPDTPVGESSSSQELTLTNQEDAIQVSSVRLLGDHPEGFSITDDQCSSKTLKKGETCTLKIQFNPKSEGEQTGILQLTIPANIAQSTVNLSGKALAANNSITPTGGDGGGGGCALSSEVSAGRICFLFAIMTGFILVGFRRAKQKLK